MLQLFSLKIAIVVWKTSIHLSKKLRPQTWMILAGLNAAISITALYAYDAKSVPDSAIPPIDHAELKPVPLPESCNVFMATLSSPNMASVIMGSEISLQWSDVSQSMAYEPLFLREVTVEPFLWQSVSWYRTYHSGSLLVVGNAPRELPWKLPNWPERARPTVVQVAESQASDLFTYLEKRVALAVSVITALLTIMNVLLAFQALRSFKAERELKNLQMAHLRLEVEKLRQEIEDAKREKEKQSGIILVS